MNINKLAKRNKQLIVKTLERTRFLYSFPVEGNEFITVFNNVTGPGVNTEFYWDYWKIGPTAFKIFAEYLKNMDTMQNKLHIDDRLHITLRMFMTGRFWYTYEESSAHKKNKNAPKHATPDDILAELIPIVSKGNIGNVADYIMTVSICLEELNTCLTPSQWYEFINNPDYHDLPVEWWVPMIADENDKIRALSA